MHNIRLQLENIQNEKLKQFNERIVNTKYKVLGIKLDVLKRIAKENINLYEDYFKQNHIYYEEYMIHGFMLGYLKKPFGELIPYINDYIKLIDNWAMVDSIVSNLKILNKYELEDLRALYKLDRSYSNYSKIAANVNRFSPKISEALRL